MNDKHTLSLFPSHISNLDSSLSYSSIPALANSLAFSHLPPYDVFPPSSFQNGQLRLTLKDLRLPFNDTTGRKISLSDSLSSRYASLYNTFTSTNPITPDDDWQDEFHQFQSKLLPIIEQPLILDPTPQVVKKMTHLTYTRSKYAQPRKRQRDWAEKEDEELKKKESNDLMLFTGLEESKRNKLNPDMWRFVNDWRKKKEMADEEVINYIGEKKRTQPANRPPTYLTSTIFAGRLIRTLQFEFAQKFSSKPPIYTTLNIYQTNVDEYEAVLRWGEELGTAKNGGMMRYPVGNLQGVEYYVGVFKNLYQTSHKIITDSVVSKSAGVVQPQNSAQSGTQQQQQTPTPQGQPSTPVVGGGNTPMSGQVNGTPLNQTQPLLNNNMRIVRPQPGFQTPPPRPHNLPNGVTVSTAGGLTLETPTANLVGGLAAASAANLRIGLTGVTNNGGIQNQANTLFQNMTPQQRQQFFAIMASNSAAAAANLVGKK